MFLFIKQKGPPQHRCIFLWALPLDELSLISKGNSTNSTKVVVISQFIAKSAFRLIKILKIL